METRQRPSGNTKRKSSTYFALAFVFLVAMALSWSVDSSFVFMFLGAACFFLFLGFYSSPDKITSQPFKKLYVQPKGKKEIPASFEEVLKRIFGPRHSTDPHRGFTASRAIPILIRVGGFIIFSIVFVTITVTILTSDSHSYDAQNYYQVAEHYYSVQQYDSAYSNYNRALKLENGYEEAMIGYGNVLRVKKMPDSALIMFNKVLESNPDYEEASYNKALVYYDQKNYREGIETLNTLIDSNPSYYDAILLMGDFYYIQANYDDAIIWYENAYDNEEIRSRILCHIMAYIYDTKGEYDKAITLYQEALGYDSSIVEIYQRLGELIPDPNGDFYRSKASQLSK